MSELENKVEDLLANGLLEKLLDTTEAEFELIVTIARRKRVELREKIIQDFLTNPIGDIAGMDTPEG